MHIPLGAHITRINPGHTMNQSEPCTCTPEIQYSVDTGIHVSVNAHSTGCALIRHHRQQYKGPAHHQLTLMS